jgi:hypothetical protein
MTQGTLNILYLGCIPKIFTKFSVALSVSGHMVHIRYFIIREFTKRPLARAPVEKPKKKKKKTPAAHHKSGHHLGRSVGAERD